MRHISLDESFWRSAAQALVSGESIEDVEPSLLDVSRLLLHLQESSNGPAGGRLGVLTLGGTEEERALGLTLAALLARRGCRVLLADCDFADQTWSRLLGAEEPDGIADHVGYGTPPRRLVRRTSWDSLALLPSGTTALHPAGILRSDKLQSCLDIAGRNHDLVCVGLPFEETLEWDKGAVAGMDRAILVGPAGEELAFELAIPRLVRRLELLATLDVPPLGRWRPGLGAALPALAQAAARSEARPDAGAEGAPAPADHPVVNGLVADQRVEDEGAFASSEREPAMAGMADRESAAPTSDRPADLSLFDVEAARARGSDRESAADVAFLASLPRGDRPPGLARMAPDPVEGPAAPARPASPPPAPPLVHPRLRAAALQQQLDLATSPPDAAAEEDLRELAQGWGQGEAALESRPSEPDPDEASAARSVWLTALAVLLCLTLGAGAFWFWRASQQIPEGQFTFVDAADQRLNDRAPTVDGGNAGPPAQAASNEETAGAEATGRETRLEVATPPEAALQPEAATQPEAAQDPAGDAARAAAAQLAASAGAPSTAPDVPPASDGVAASVADAPVDGAAGPEGQGETAGAPVRAAKGSEAAEPAVTYEPPASGPLLSYSLHVGSYQTFDAAQRAAQALRARGLAAFVAPVLLEGKGQWNRVFVDALPDAPASQQSLAHARRTGAVAEGAVRETPWALYLGTFATPALAQELIARLARSGVSGYAVGTGPVHVYAGAFEAAGDAEILNRQLRDRGFESALVRRRGVETR